MIIVAFVVLVIIALLIITVTVVLQRENYSYKDMDRASITTGLEWDRYASGRDVWPNTVLSVSENDHGRYVSGNKNSWANIAV